MEEAAPTSPKTGKYLPNFLIRVGMLLASPRRALADIQARRTGGVADALLVLVFSVLCGRMADLVRAVLMVRESSWAGTLQQILAIFGLELRPALFLVLPAGLIITALAGRGRRDPGLDIELGAACAVPYLLLSGLAQWAGGPAVGSIAAGRVGSVLTLVALAWGCVILVLAVRLARQRPVEGTTDGQGATAVAPGKRDRWAAHVIGGVLLSVLTVNVVWLSHNRDAVAPVGRGVMAPDFELTRIDGTPGRLSLRDLRGKVVLLDFWARWCPSCVAMMPTLHDIYAAQSSRDVEFLAINAEGAVADKEGIREFLRQHPAPYPHLLDDREVGGLYRVVSLPHVVIIGRDGVIRRVMVGQRRKSELEAEIQRALDGR